MGPPPPSLKFVWKYCRMCALELRQGGSVFIFGDEGKRLQLPEKIRKTLAILVLEEDILPKKICTDCCSSLEDYSQYKDTVLDAQEKLASIARILDRQQNSVPDNVPPPPPVPLTSSSSSSILQQVLLSSSSPDKDKDKPTEDIVVVELEDNNYSAEPIIGEEDEVKEGTSPRPLSPVKVTKSKSKKNKNPSSKDFDNPSSPSSSWVLQCGICGTPTGSRDALISHHNRDHHKDKYASSPVYGCSFCPRISENYNALRLHIYRHLKEEEGTYKCSHVQCERTFPTKDQLERHWNAVHNPAGKAYPCKICGKRFTAKCTLVTHMTSKHPLQGDDEGQEDQENQQKDENESLKGQEDHHQDVPEVEEDYQPAPSPMDTSPPPVVENQDQNEEQGPSSSSPPQQRAPPPEAIEVEKDNPPKEHKKKSKTDKQDDKGFWKCPECDKQFETRRGYELHIPLHLGKRYECDHCDKTFTQKHSLMHHTTSQHNESPRQYKCETCSKEFFTKKLLRRHSRLHTTLKEESKCPVCQKSYKSRLHLQSHMKIHKSKLNFPCDSEGCDKRFANQYKLTIHKNAQHTGERSFKCPNCEYAARTPGPYYKHLKTHNRKKEDITKVKKNNEILGTPTPLSPAPPPPVSSPSSVLEDLSTKSPQKQAYLHLVTTSSVPPPATTHHLVHVSSNNNNPLTSSTSHTTHPVPLLSITPATPTMDSSHPHPHHNHHHQDNHNPHHHNHDNIPQQQQQLPPPPPFHHQTQTMYHANQGWNSGGTVTTNSSKSSYPNPNNHNNSNNNPNNIPTSNFEVIEVHSFEGLNAHGQNYQHHQPHPQQHQHQQQPQPMHAHNGYGSSTLNQQPQSLNNQVHAHHTHTTTTTVLHISPTTAHHSTSSSGGGNLSLAPGGNSTGSSGGNPNNYGNHQSEPMELSYKLHLDNNNGQDDLQQVQDMPMELTKVFQRDPLELCVRTHEFNQLMDLSSRGGDDGGITLQAIPIPISVSNNNTILAGLGGYHKDLVERELTFSDLSGAFRQPIDLIAHTDEGEGTEICSEGNLVDLSLRSTFVQDQSTFLRELIDLSARSDSTTFHNEPNTNITTTSNNKQNHNHPHPHSHPHHKGGGGSGSGGGNNSNSVTFIYQDSMLSL